METDGVNKTTLKTADNLARSHLLLSHVFSPYLTSTSYSRSHATSPSLHFFVLLLTTASSPITPATDEPGCDSPRPVVSG